MTGNDMCATSRDIIFREIAANGGFYVNARYCYGAPYAAANLQAGRFVPQIVRPVISTTSIEETI